ncbi:MAG TPA: hypothetical protein VIU85_03505 [Chthoniobacterales bacterium]
MAKKSKADAAASGKVSKPKSRARSASAGLRRDKSTSTKLKKPSASTKPAAGKIESATVPITLAVFDPTDDQISMRAYFISERRRRLDLPGDANSDWLEAKRQLLAETRH